MTPRRRRIVLIVVVGLFALCGFAAIVYVQSGSSQVAEPPLDEAPDSALEPATASIQRGERARTLPQAPEPLDPTASIPTVGALTKHPDPSWMPAVYQVCWPRDAEAARAPSWKRCTEIDPDLGDRVMRERATAACARQLMSQLEHPETAQALAAADPSIDGGAALVAVGTRVCVETVLASGEELTENGTASFTFEGDFVERLLDATGSELSADDTKGLSGQWIEVRTDSGQDADAETPVVSLHYRDSQETMWVNVGRLTD